MKLLIIPLLLLSYNSICQINHGIVAGLDSTALEYKIKSKVVRTIRINNSERDTIRIKMYDYLQNGFLHRFDELDITNLDTSSYWHTGHRFIEFEYNESGYLVNENIHWNQPINESEEPDSSIVTTTRIYRNNKLLQETTTQTAWYAKKENFTATNITSYNMDGSKDEEFRSPSYHTKYIYKTTGLLERVEYYNSDQLIEIQTIEYTLHEN